MGNEDKRNQQWFDERIGTKLRRLDEAFEPQAPELQTMEVFVAEGKIALREKMRRDMLIFVLLAAIVVAVMAWTINRNLALFVALQALTALSVAGWMALHLLRLAWKGRTQWKRN
ncbi:YxlC family protein [Paenibacillus agaridevorans]|uniref:YxlC family protein n=1 Tax=Paenibacillus agaridevorans TaxID=171404 RepID=UPI001BE44B3F|nr:YxlC family protein [Paenibacillus agaridevorans]